MGDRKRITCVKHGGNLLPDSFYMATPEDSVFSGIGRIPICKNCLFKMADEYFEKYNDYAYTIYLMCQKVDIAYYSGTFEGAMKAGDTLASKVFQRYIVQFNSLGEVNNSQLPFIEGEHIFVGEIEKPNKAKEEKPKDELEDLKKIKLNREDKKAKQEVIDLIGYDPFEGYSEADQKFLYSDLLNYFGDEDVVEDQFLVSQIIQIVNNNNQIRKLDYLLSNYMADNETLGEKASTIKSLNATKKDIVQNTDKIAKENRISVKSRAGSNINKSSLTVMMERLRSLNFEDAEIDFYDQKKALGMKRAAEISIKAIEEQLQFDENDMGNMITEQRNMIREMEEKILDLQEKNRQLHVEIEKLKKK